MQEEPIPFLLSEAPEVVDAGLWLFRAVLSQSSLTTYRGKQETI